MKYTIYILILIATSFSQAQSVYDYYYIEPSARMSFPHGEVQELFELSPGIGGAFTLEQDVTPNLTSFITIGYTHFAGDRITYYNPDGENSDTRSTNIDLLSGHFGIKVFYHYFFYAKITGGIEYLMYSVDGADYEIESENQYGLFVGTGYEYPLTGRSFLDMSVGYLFDTGDLDYVLASIGIKFSLSNFMQEPK